MNQNDIIHQITLNRALTKQDVTKVLAAYCEVVTQALERGEEVTLHKSLGKLKVKEHAARKGRNPATGESIVIPPGKRVVFKAATALKEAVA
jgi:DNA-binding protein HU-beta